MNNKQPNSSNKAPNYVNSKYSQNRNKKGYKLAQRPYAKQATSEQPDASQNQEQTNNQPEDFESQNQGRGGFRGRGNGRGGRGGRGQRGGSGGFRGRGGFVSGDQQNNRENNEDGFPKEIMKEAEKAEDNDIEESEEESEFSEEKIDKETEKELEIFKRTYVMPETTAKEVNIRESNILQEIAANSKVIQENFEVILPSLIDILAGPKSDDDIQIDLCDLLGYDEFDTISGLISNREEIRKVVKMAKIKAENERKTEAARREKQGAAMTTAGVEFQKSKKFDKFAGNDSNYKVLEQLGFSVGLIEESKKLGLKYNQMDSLPKQNYEPYSRKANQTNNFNVETEKRSNHLEVTITPYCQPRDVFKLVPVEKLPKFFRKAFPFDFFNEIQSTVFETALFTSENILISAPTGAGKTNIALMTILKEVFRQLNEIYGDIENIEAADLAKIKWNFKIVYLVPLKALANEIVNKFETLLKFLRIKVNEFSGDVNLTKEQIEETTLFIAIPEKWDLFTRKNETIYSIVNLIIIDEIHIINEDRGRVLECIIARAKDASFKMQKKTRYVGLSATMPNYQDIADFIEVPPKGLFFFDSSYRATPLTMKFLATTIRTNNYFEQKKTENEITYDKIIEFLNKGKQVLVFVHSRNETSNFCQEILKLAQENDQEHMFVAQRSKLFATAANNFHNPLLKRVTQYGLGFHHAGLIRKDRNMVEKLFAEKNMNVLVSTSTLAWGVNLPAYAVIIKGTQYYDATKGGLVNIGVLDIQQMFGRAGRPQFDTEGVGVIVSTKETLEHYVKLLQNQIPIESKLLKYLEDSLNAEISMGNIRNLSDGVAWLKSTYLAVRMGVSCINKDVLENEFYSLVNSAYERLNNFKIIRYLKDTGNVHATELGRIASRYYMSYITIAKFNNLLNDAMTDADFFNLFSESEEFNSLKIYPEEIKELDELKGLCPVKTDNKAITLLFVYLHGFSEFKNSSLYMDSNYIADNASRVMRAMYEISVHKRLVYTSKMVLNYVKATERRVIPSRSAVWQFTFLSFKGNSKNNRLHDSNNVYVNENHCEKIDAANLNLNSLLYEDTKVLSYQLNLNANWVKHIKKQISSMPNLKIKCVYKPITRTILNVEMNIRCNFVWNKRWNGNIEPFLLIVDNEHEIIHHETFNIIQENTEDKELTLNFCIPFEIDSGAKEARDNKIYKIGVHSDRWVDVKFVDVLYLNEIEVPFEEEVSTVLLDLKPLPLSALKNENFENYYKGSFTHFNPVQSQVFFSCYKSDTNILVGAPTGSGKTVIAELTMLKLFRDFPGQKVIYIAPMKSLAKERLKDWSKKMESLNKKVLELTGDFTPDVADLLKADILITTPEKWDGISRNWFHRDYVKKVGLVVIDEIHLLGLDRGPVLEVIVSRMRYISEKTKISVRFVGLSTALANALDVAKWLGIEKENSPGLFNFKPAVRPCPVTVHIEGFPEKHYCPRMATMNKPCFMAIQEKSKNKPVLIFVSSRRQTRLTAFDLIAFCANSGKMSYLNVDPEEIHKIIENVKDENLRHTLSFGIGMHHAGLSENDRNIVEDLFYSSSIQVLIATSTLAWGVNFPAHLCIIKGTEYFDPKKQCYVELPITDVLQMIGRAGRPQYDDSAVACLFVSQDKKNFYKKFLYEPFPLESVYP